MRWHSANTAWAKFTLLFLLGQFTVLGIINLRKPQQCHHFSGEKPTALACSPSPSGLATVDLTEQLLPCQSPDCTASNLTEKLLCSIKGAKASMCWRGHYLKQQSQDWNWGSPQSGLIPLGSNTKSFFFPGCILEHNCRSSVTVQHCFFKEKKKKKRKRRLSLTFGNSSAVAESWLHHHSSDCTGPTHPSSPRHQPAVSSGCPGNKKHHRHSKKTWQHRKKKRESEAEILCVLLKKRLTCCAVFMTWNVAQSRTSERSGLWYLAV